MERRWFIGAGWVGTVMVGGTVLLATGLVRPGPQASPGAGSSTNWTAPAGPLGAGDGGSRSAEPPASSARPDGSPAAPAGEALGVATPGSLAPILPDRGPAVAPPAAGGVPVPGGPAGPGTSPSPPARVAAVSYLLDILESASRVSPGVANGAAATVLSAALRDLPTPVQEAVASGSAKLAEQLSTQTPRTIGDVRSLVAHLSVANPEVNQALSFTAAALSGMATPAISPLDQTARQLSETLGALAEPRASSSPNAPAS